MNKYAKRDHEDLEPEYLEHLSAMTGENLHSKSDIAAELAFRDRKILQLRTSLDSANEVANRLAKAKDVYEAAMHRVTQLESMLESSESALRLWEKSMMSAIGEDGPGSVVEAIEKLKADATPVAVPEVFERATHVGTAWTFRGAPNHDFWDRKKDAEREARKFAAPPAPSAQPELMPGVMRCAKCDVQVIRANLNMAQGSVAAGDSETEPCPNGCGPLWPVTMREYVSQLEETIEFLQDKAHPPAPAVDERAKILTDAIDQVLYGSLLDDVNRDDDGMTSWLDNSNKISFWVDVLKQARLRAQQQGGGHE